MNIALLVGINKYKMPGNDLRGCVNDVENMRKLLTEKCGFSVMQIKTLTDKQATKKNIVCMLDKMINQAGPGDHLVFHNSSHGSQVPDTKGDEPDRMTEILCPYDLDWKGTYITDDEMHDLFEQLHTSATADIILDSCHSGDMLRDEGSGIAKFIPYPLPMPKTSLVTPPFMSGWGLPNVALWSGCKSNQTSADAVIDGKPQGAMTWGFYSTVTSLMKYGAGTREELLRQLKLLVCKKFDQIPQLEASKEMMKRRVFT